MKIGIVTFHFPLNYGAMIQAYAMQQYLIGKGHDTYIIDYQPAYHLKWYPKPKFFNIVFEKNIIKTLRTLIGGMLIYRVYSKRYAAFQDFLTKRMKLCPYRQEADYSEFDSILLGSDQIWNLKNTDNRFDGVYYGDQFRCRVFSYAASNRSKSFTEYEKSQYQEKLSKLYAVGVRESQLQKLLQPLTEKKVHLNLDPTLLAGADCFKDLNLERPLPKRYVLVYELIDHPEVRSMAESYANQIGAVCVSLSGYARRWQSEYYDYEAGPEKFLAYIKNAECVFTSSFHGTALSIVFNVNFYSIRQNNSADMRIESILSQLGLVHRFINFEDKPVIEDILYGEVNQKMDILRIQSVEYIDMSLSL